MPEEIVSRTFSVKVTETREVLKTEKVWAHHTETDTPNGKVNGDFAWEDKPGMVVVKEIEWLDQLIETSTPDAVVKAIVRAALGLSGTTTTV